MGRKGFRRSVANAAPGELRRQIDYKARWSGRTLSVVDRWYPSSKTCSDCGAVNKALTLNQRHWTCPACGAEHDRDDNAAVNIEREGLRLLAESGPDGRTPMSGGTDARGDLGAVAEAQVIALPQHRRSTNRELAAGAARRTAQGAGLEPAARAGRETQTITWRADSRASRPLQWRL